MRGIFTLFTVGLLAFSCQVDPDRSQDAVLLAGWGDVPVPRGFETVVTTAAEASLEIGEFRRGDFVLEGRGRAEDIEAYFLDRLPLHGWTWDPQQSLWHKLPTTLSLSVTPIEKSGYGSAANWSRIDLRVRSQRPGT